MSQPDPSAPPDPWASVPGAVAPPAGPPGAPAPGYGPYGPGPYPPPGGVPPYYFPGYRPPPKRTNSMAIAALVCGICGFVYLIPALLGIIFGIIGLRQTNRDRTEGRGMAIAGIVTGAFWLVAFIVLIVVISIVAANNSGQ